MELHHGILRRAAAPGRGTTGPWRALGNPCYDLSLGTWESTGRASFDDRTGCCTVHCHVQGRGGGDEVKLQQWQASCAVYHLVRRRTECNTSFYNSWPAHERIRKKAPIQSTRNSIATFTTHFKITASGGKTRFGGHADGASFKARPSRPSAPAGNPVIASWKERRIVLRIVAEYKRQRGRSTVIITRSPNGTKHGHVTIRWPAQMGIYWKRQLHQVPTIGMGESDGSSMQGQGPWGPRGPVATIATSPALHAPLLSSWTPPPPFALQGIKIRHAEVQSRKSRHTF